MSFLYIVESFIQEFPMIVYISALFLIWTLFWKTILYAENISRKSCIRKQCFFHIFQMNIHRFWTVFLFCLMPCMKKIPDMSWLYLDNFTTFLVWFSVIITFIENPTRTRRDYKRILQLKQVLEFIEKNYANPITLQELSASVSMSPKYFCRFFSEMTHQTPVDYLNRQRIEEACLQLAATDDSITEIAYRNGFNDLSYFIRTFKKYKGMTPGKYKRR